MYESPTLKGQKLMRESAFLWMMEQLNALKVSQLWQCLYLDERDMWHFCSYVLVVPEIPQAYQADQFWPGRFQQYIRNRWY